MLYERTAIRNSWRDQFYSAPAPASCPIPSLSASWSSAALFIARRVCLARLRAARIRVSAYRLWQSNPNFFAVRGINTPPPTSPLAHEPIGDASDEREPVETIADFARYAEAKRAWEAAHPRASAAEHAAAMQRLARECGV